MDVWVIYFSPKDFPNKYVVRKHLVGKFNNEITSEHYVGDTLDEVRAKVPMDLIRYSRSETENPVIVECWL